MLEFSVLILVPTAVALVLFFFWGYLDDRAGRYKSSSLGNFFGTCGGFITAGVLVMFVVWGTAAINTRSTVNDMVAFYNSNQDNYRFAVENTEDVDIVAAEPGLLDVAYIEQGKLTGQRIVEFRNRANLYNITLQRYRDMNTSWFLGAFYHDPPDFLRPIVLLGEASSP